MISSRASRLRSTLLASVLAVGSLVPLATPAAAADENLVVNIIEEGGDSQVTDGVEDLTVRAIKVDASGQPVAGGGSSFLALDDGPPGRYTFVDLPPGSYKVEAFGDGFTSTRPPFGSNPYMRTWSGNAPSFATATAISIDGDTATSHSISIDIPFGGRTINITTVQDGTNQFINGICASAYNSAGDLVMSRSQGGSSIGLNFLRPDTYKIEFEGTPLIPGDCDNNRTHVYEWYENGATLGDPPGASVADPGTDPVVLEAGSNTNITASLAVINNNRTISGTVTRNGGGIPQSITVTPFQLDGLTQAGDSTTTNASGGYTLNVTAGQYLIEFSDTFAGDSVVYATEWFNNRPSRIGANPVDVRTASATGINASLDEAGTITGRVTRPDTSDDIDTLPDPSVGATVEIYRVTNGTVGDTPEKTATTNSNGDYSVTGIFPGTFRLFVEPPAADEEVASEWFEDSSDSTTADDISLASGQTQSGINVNLNTAADLRGKVRDAGTLAPLQGVCVAAYRPGGTFAGFALTNASGDYSIEDLGVGQYKLRGSDGDDQNCGGSRDLPGIEHASVWYNDNNAEGINFETATTVELTSNGLTGLDISLPESAGVLSGRATENTASGPALANVCIRVWDAQQRILRETVTNGSGNWSVGGLPPQSIRVEYRPDLQSGDNCFVTGADRLGVTDGNATDQGAPPGGQGLGNEFYEDKTSFADATPVPMLAGQNRPSIDEDLPRVNLGSNPGTGPARITGRVTEPDGPDDAPPPGPIGAEQPDPVSGVCVAAMLLDWDGRESTIVKTAVTDANGNYELTGLARDTLFRIRYSNDPALCPTHPQGTQQTGFNTTEWYSGKSSFETANAIRTAGGQNPVTPGINEQLAYSGIVTGQVTDEEVGGGIAATVRIYRAEDGALVRSVKTLNNGTYKIGGLPLGDYKVEFIPDNPNYRAEFFNDVGNLAAATAITIVKDASVNASAGLAPNRAPVAGDDEVTVEVNSSTTFNDLTANDLDEDGDEVTIVAVEEPTPHGTVTLNDDGSVTFVPGDDRQDTATFEYTVSDPSGLEDEATVTVNIVGEIIGVPPLAADDEASTAQNQSVTIDVLANDTDPDGDDTQLTIEAIGTPFHGTAVVSSNAILYTPDDDFVGADQFTYQIQDSQGFQDTGKVTVQVGTSGPNQTSQTVGSGGVVGTDGTNADENNLIITTVRTPNAGTVTIREFNGEQTTTGDLTLIAPRVDVTAPNATTANPLTITFRIDGSVLQGLQPQRAIRVLRNGTLVQDCLGSAVASPNPCLAGHQRIGDDLLLTIRTSQASIWTFGFLDEAVVDRAATAGGDRVDTAVRVARQAFNPSEVDTIVLARADNYPDALAGAPLAHELGGPLLLTNSSALNAITRDEIVRLGASTVILLGGPNAISSGVENTVRNLPGVQNVERIAGADRFETAALIADRLPAHTSAYVVEGANANAARGWPDAVSVASLAAFQGRPILLVTRDVLPGPTRTALNGLSEAIVIGGSNAVSNNVFEQVRQAVGGTANRIAGSDRFDTSYRVALAARAAGMSESSTWVATGLNFPDALAAGAAVAKEGGILLLVHGQDYAASPRVKEWMTAFRDQIESVSIAGGPAAVSTAVEAGIRADVDN